MTELITPRAPGSHADARAPLASGLPPAPLTSFIGRAREVGAIRALLGETRLLTLTGAGGSGKTRLALETAHRAAAERPDGVAWVELAPLQAPEALESHVAAALGVREEGVTRLQDAIAAALGDRALLLVLDNCEHVVQAAATFAERNLRRCPALRILATSREPLGVAGERAWLVPPLSLPGAARAADAASLLEFEAVSLFVDRARDVLASFALTPANADAVAQICRRLDGMPLAIELAAARVRVLTPEKIAERLDDAFRLLSHGGRTAVPRHRTLRAAIQWSYDLLAAREQTLLRRLSVFAGGFTLEAAEAVCAGAPIEADEVLDLLAALVDKSLVAMDAGERDPRYRLLETVRQYAAELFAADPAAAEVRRRHAEFYFALAEASAPRLFLMDNDAPALQRLDAEYGNLTAAAEWLDADAEGADRALRLATALDWYFYARGRFAVAREWLERALVRRDRATALTVARALIALAHHGLWSGEMAATGAAGEEAMRLARTLGERRVLADAVSIVGSAAAFTGDFARAIPLLDEAAALATGPDEELLVFVLGVRGYVELLRGDLAEAERVNGDVLSLMERLGFRAAVADVQPGRGQVALARGDHAAAMGHFAEGIALALRYDRGSPLVHNLEGVVAVAEATGDAERAARLLGATWGIRARTGMRHEPFVNLNERIVARLRDALGPARFEALVAEGRAMSVERAVAHARERAAGDAPRAATDEPPAERPAVSEPVSAPATTAPAPASRPAPPDAEPAVLRVLALGPLEIWRDGARMSDAAWKYAKPRELLLYLLAHPEGRTREQIGLVFWPDASAAQVKNNFHVVLHHLRKSLGRAELVAFEGDRYRVGWELGVDFDAATFEREARAALDALRRHRGEGEAAALERLRAAVALYRGDFLAEDDAGDWHLEIRDRLSRMHADALREIGERLERAGAWSEAADAYRRIVLADELNEDACRRLMRCLTMMGERAAALRQYERLSALLRADLEAEPEPATVALQERIRRGEAV